MVLWIQGTEIMRKEKMADWKETLSGYLQTAGNYGKAAAQSAAKKGKEIANTSKCKREIVFEEDMIRSYKMVIGEYVMAHDLLGEDPVIQEQRERIRECTEKIQALQERIRVLQSKK